MRAIFWFFIVLSVFFAGCGGSSTTSVVMPDPHQGTWSGEFSFYPGSNCTIDQDDDFEIRYEGNTPPPSFEIKVESMDNTVHFCPPELEIHVKYAREDSGWHGNRYEYGWLCYPKYWIDDCSYIVIVLVGGAEVASNRYHFRDRSSG